VERSGVPVASCARGLLACEGVFGRGKYRIVAEGDRYSPSAARTLTLTGLVMFELSSTRITIRAQR
jgi:hypothetical protein